MQGKIIKGIGGFYFVKPFDSSFLSETIRCKPRGVMRFQGKTPLVGDVVELEADKNGEYSITKIYPRENELVRPPVSNVTQALICISTDEPKPNALVLEKLIVNAIYNDIEPVICITKMDLDPDLGERIRKVYDHAGFKVLTFTNGDGDDIDKLLDLIASNTSFFAGPSGVGKSTLGNRFSPVKLETGDTSRKLKRGKHTTRHVELIEIDPHSFILDTPGFSSLELDESLLKEDLKFCYPEFSEHACRFSDCNHLSEPGCGVREAVKEGRINAGRYRRYVELYKQLEERKNY